MSWGKQYEGACDDRKFDLIAECAGSTYPNVWAVWSSAWDYSLQHNGSIARLNLELVAHRWRLALAEVERIWHEMVRLGMVAGDKLRAWAERQAHKVSTVAETGNKARCARYRANRRRRERDGAVIDLVAAASDMPRSTERDMGEGMLRHASPLDSPSEMKREEGPPYSPPHEGGTPPPFAAMNESRMGEEAASAGNPGGGRAAEPSTSPLQGEILLPLRGGKSRGFTGSPTRRRSPHQALFDSARRRRAARQRANELSAGWGGSDPGSGDGLAATAA